MGFDCGTWFAKYVLCIFNFLFFVLGTILLGTGIWLAVDKASLIVLLKMVESEHINQFTQPAVIEQLAYVLIACGAVMFLMSFLGYCGAIRESKCLLSMYGILMIMLLVTELVVGGLVAAYKDRARDETKTFLQSTITSYYSTTENTDAVTMMWNQIMSTLSCCGVNDYTDFESSNSWTQHKGNRTIPEACCVLSDFTKYIPRDPECTTKPNISNSYYKTGCYEAIIAWITEHQDIICYVLLGVGVTHLVAIFFAFCLCRSVAKYHGMRL